jgi:hypothetical protein
MMLVPSHSLTFEELRLCLVLTGVQICDGVLTGIGVTHFGLEAEGNVLLRQCMEMIGAIPALLILKSLSILATAPMIGYIKHLSWLPLMMKGVIGLYVVFAIVPWCFVICTRILLL